jgi:hypothetical protein
VRSAASLSFTALGCDAGTGVTLDRALAREGVGTGAEDDASRYARLRAGEELEIVVLLSCSSTCFCVRVSSLRARLAWLAFGVAALEGRWGRRGGGGRMRRVADVAEDGVVPVPLGLTVGVSDSDALLAESDDSDELSSEVSLSCRAAWT